jgi:hypothetical protein
MLILSRKPGEAIVMEHPFRVEGPRLEAFLLPAKGSGSPGGAAGPAPCQAMILGGKPRGTSPSRPDVQTGRAAQGDS